MLCTLTMTSNIDSTGVARYPLGSFAVMDPATGATLIDELGRRSYTTSIAFGPSIGKNIALAYLPYDYCQVGRELQIQYFTDVYPVKVEAVGYGALYDPENTKARS
jgi:sarcosine dehydrogenase